MEDNGEEYIRVSFERPTENGFDTVVFELPSYEIVEQEGNYSEEEIKKFRETVEKGAHLFFKYAREGGLKFAQQFKNNFVRQRRKYEYRQIKYNKRNSGVL